MPSATTSRSLVQAKKNLTKFLKTLDTVPIEELEKSEWRNMRITIVPNE